MTLEGTALSVPCRSVVRQWLSWPTFGEAPARFPPKRFAFLALVRQAGANETAEERMRLVRFALEFRVVLAGEKKRVIAQLD